ncbi:transposase [Kalymmatonema gypsitolerans NIES-4073]|nr:transposase [Scytonema sp. NIES-4073]
MVVQEVYGLLLGHWAIRSLIFQAATSADVAPLRLSFTGTAASCSSCPPQISAFETTRTSLFLSWLTVEILDQVLPERTHRNNPRVVKKFVSKFRSKKVKHRGIGAQMNPPVVVVLSTA